ncbi:uncharacterized protein [Argopecten irradians]|uniref:uncharacterized protein n=1 Tax=Argopecten irradians TaxID=31199 RepID=UPI0037193DE9
MSRQILCRDNFRFKQNGVSMFKFSREFADISFDQMLICSHPDLIDTEPDRLCRLRTAFTDQGFSGRATDEAVICDYLVSLGRSYSVANTHRSMLSQTLELLNCNVCLNSKRISRVIKGLFNENPPMPRYVETWDVSKVLIYLKNLPCIETLSLRDLSLKLVCLIALTTAQRCQTLAALDVDSMSWSGDTCTFYVKALLKTSKPGKSSTVVKLYRYEKDVTLDVLTVLKQYLSVTRKRRKSRKLFISYKTFDEVSPSTISRWVKEVLSAAGIDPIFKAHSTRGAASSQAFRAGVPLRDILKTANWASARTFATFYQRDVSDGSVFANSVLQTAA